MSADLHTPLRTRETRIQHDEESLVRPQHVFGTFTLYGAGEKAVEVPFPVTFVEKPGFSFGADMDENSPVVQGAMPTISVVVLRWLTTPKLNGDYYIGALFGAVNSGDPDQIMHVHWHCKGKAFRNPIRDLGSTDGAI